jgi:hypothetical protein
MLKNDLNLRSPVESIIGIDNTINGAFGAVLSRAGVGKTRFLVQIALTRLLRDERIIHVSLDEPMEKINLRYQEAYQSLVDSIGYVDPLKAHRLWEDVKMAKVGISYSESTFDTAKLREYLRSFKTVQMPLPTLMILDGLNFDGPIDPILQDLKTLNQEFSIFIWFSVRTHREETPGPDGFPIQLTTRKDLFDKVVFLKPVHDKIQAVVLKDGPRTDSTLLLNPATMMPSVPDEA